MNKASAFVVAIALGILAAPAFAATLITTTPLGGTTTTFTPTGYINTGGPTTAAINGITVTGAQGFSYGNTGYGLVGNGSWLNGFSFVATDSETRTLTFDLGGNYGAVGSFMNYAVAGYGTPIITALNSAMGVVGSYNLLTNGPISTPGGSNAGAFRGIESSANDIRYFQMTGGYLLAHNLTTAAPAAAAAVPEPSTWAMMLVGFGAIGFAMRRKQRQTVRVNFA